MQSMQFYAPHCERGRAHPAHQRLTHPASPNNHQGGGEIRSGHRLQRAPVVALCVLMRAAMVVVHKNVNTVSAYDVPSALCIPTSACRVGNMPYVPQLQQAGRHFEVTVQTFFRDMPTASVVLERNKTEYGQDIRGAVQLLMRQRPAFVALYNRCAKESDEAGPGKATARLSATQSELELDMIGHVERCDADFWNGVEGNDTYSVQNLASHKERPKGVDKGSAKYNTVVVEATRSNDIRILQFKLCKLEKNLTWLHIHRGARSSTPINEYVSFCALATEVQDKSSRVTLRQQLEDFVWENRATLVHVAQLYNCGQLLLMQVHGKFTLCPTLFTVRARRWVQ